MQTNYIGSQYPTACNTLKSSCNTAYNELNYNITYSIQTGRNLSHSVCGGRGTLNIKERLQNTKFQWLQCCLIPPRKLVNANIYHTFLNYLLIKPKRWQLLQLCLIFCYFIFSLKVSFHFKHVCSNWSVTVLSPWGMNPYNIIYLKVISLMSL